MDAVAEAPAFAGAIADESMGALVMAVVVGAKRRGRDEAVGAGVVELARTGRSG
jgi:hypothetical protein